MLYLQVCFSLNKTWLKTRIKRRNSCTKQKFILCMLFLLLCIKQKILRYRVDLMNRKTCFVKKKSLSVFLYYYAGQQIICNCKFCKTSYHANHETSEALNIRTTFKYCDALIDKHTWMPLNYITTSLLCYESRCNLSMLNTLYFVYLPSLFYI